jgi:hypothetical protein
MKHERDRDSWQHETSFVCLNCRQRIEHFASWDEDKLVCPGPWPGRWHWVRGKDWKDWSLAVRTPVDGWNASGGWGNLDTWEDFDREITEWKLIPLPEELP